MLFPPHQVSAAEPVPRSARPRGVSTNVRADGHAKRRPLGLAAPIDSTRLASAVLRARNLSTAAVPYSFETPVSRPEKGRRGKHSTENCNEPACSGFSRVGLVLSVTVTERLPWLLDYALWFAAVHYLVPARYCADCICRLRRYAHSTPVLCDCADDFAKGAGVGGLGSNAFIHVAATRSMMHLAASAQARNSPVRGVMFAHMDMWINVRSVYYRGDVPLDSVWVPYGGMLSAWHKTRAAWVNGSVSDSGALGPYCTLAGASWRERAPTHIVEKSPGCSRRLAWRRNAPAVPALSRSSEYVHTSRAADIPLRYCCYGWSDIFYVPHFALEAFSRLTGALRSEPVEVAIPTVAALLEEQASVPWWKMPCIGDCCRQLKQPSAYSPYTITTLCAHKLALDKPQYRALLTHTLHPNATRAKEFVQEDATRFRAEMRSFNPTYSPRLGSEGGYGMSPTPRNATPIRRCGEGPSPAWVEAPHATR